MKKIVAAFVLCIAISACSDPKQIIFGPEPLKQMSEQSDTFRKLSEQDRMLLVGYLTAADLKHLFGGQAPMVTGKTVSEVLRDAEKWKVLVAKQEEEKKIEAQRLEEEKKKVEKEIAALKEKIEKKKSEILGRINQSVTLAIVEKDVLPENYDAGRYSRMLSFTYAIENKSDRPIVQINAIARFTDPTGSEIGWLPIKIDKQIKPKSTIKTDLNKGWKLNEFLNSDIEKIARSDFELVKTSIDITDVAFKDGEVLSVPSGQE